MYRMGTEQCLDQCPGSSSHERALPNGRCTPRPATERGASWSYGETKILLALWGQDMVQRQLTNSKRTRHVWEKIAERIRESGYDRTSDQVRTRVFNMIAEYRRILKNPSPERKKKCIFFDALHQIYQAKDSAGLENAIRSYADFGEQYTFDPIEFASNEDNGDFNAEDNNSDNEFQHEMFSYAIHHMDDINDNSSNDNNYNEETSSLPLPKRFRYDHPDLSIYALPRSAKLNSNSNVHENYKPETPKSHPYDHANGVLEHSATAQLIDRMFVHLSQEIEVMRELVHFERERLAQEIARRKEEREREERRERIFLEVLTKLQDQVISLLAHQTLHPTPAPASNAALSQNSPPRSTASEPKQTYTSN